MCPGFLCLRFVSVADRGGVTYSEAGAGESEPLRSPLSREGRSRDRCAEGFYH